MLLTHIAEVADEPLVLDPNDPEAETRTNTWSLSAPADERATLTVNQVVAAFVDTATRLGRRVSALSTDVGATFYVWHDAQAGQLRCSTSSQPAHALPFRAAYTTTTALEPIIAAFLDDSRPGLIAWDDLTAAENDDDTDHASATLNIWVHPVGQGTPR